MNIEWVLWTKGWFTSWACAIFHPATLNDSHLKNMWIVNFYNFPLSIFRQRLTGGNWNQGKWNCALGQNATCPRTVYLQEKKSRFFRGREGVRLSGLNFSSDTYCVILEKIYLDFLHFTFLICKMEYIYTHLDHRVIVKTKWVNISNPLQTVPCS